MRIYLPEKVNITFKGSTEISNKNRGTPTIWILMFLLSVIVVP